MTEVSVRELKAKLAEYLRRAEAGEEIAVVRRGRRVAVIRQDAASTRAMTREEKWADLERRGIVGKSSGKKFVSPTTRIKLRGDGPSISEMIIEDRG